MPKPDIDLLFITHRRPTYTRLALEAMLAAAVPGVRVWIWHNGTDAETLEIVRGVRDHPAVHRYHESEENKRLYSPLAWVMKEGTGAFLSKLDDDCILPKDWASRMSLAHEAYDRFGVLGAWRFQPEDFDRELATPKLREYGGVRILENLWVEGSGFVMRREALESVGGIRFEEPFTDLAIRIARRFGGDRRWVNGWLMPFVRQRHLDDPREPGSLLRSDADLLQHLPLSAQRTGVASLGAWLEQLKASARTVQGASLRPRDHLECGRELKRILLDLRCRWFSSGEDS
jgi:hypothetical protein